MVFNSAYSDIYPQQQIVVSCTLRTFAFELADYIVAILSLFYVEEESAAQLNRSLLL